MTENEILQKHSSLQEYEQCSMAWSYEGQKTSPIRSVKTAVNLFSLPTGSTRSKCECVRMLARDQLRVQAYQRTSLPALARRGQQWSSKYYCLLSANPLHSPLSTTTFSLLSTRPPSAIVRLPKVHKPYSAYPKKAPHKLFSLCNILCKCIVICTLKCIATSEGSLEQWHCILFPCQVLPLIHNAAKMSAA